MRPPHTPPLSRSSRIRCDGKPCDNRIGQPPSRGRKQPDRRHAAAGHREGRSCSALPRRGAPPSTRGAWTDECLRSTPREHRSAHGSDAISSSRRLFESELLLANSPSRPGRAIPVRGGARPPNERSADARESRASRPRRRSRSPDAACFCGLLQHHASRRHESPRRARRADARRSHHRRASAGLVWWKRYRT